MLDLQVITTYLTIAYNYAHDSYLEAMNSYTKYNDDRRVAGQGPLNSIPVIIFMMVISISLIILILPLVLRIMFYLLFGGLIMFMAYTLFMKESVKESVKES
jgi:4-hydroxybenzoate polyprenyltransferase